MKPRQRSRALGARTVSHSSERFTRAFVFRLQSPFCRLSSGFARSAQFQEEFHGIALPSCSGEVVTPGFFTHGRDAFYRSYSSQSRISHG